MSKARLASAVPVISILAFLFFTEKKNATIAAKNMHGLGSLGKFKAPKFKKAINVAVNPVAQIREGTRMAETNKTAHTLLLAAQTAGNPVMQVKKIKDIVNGGITGKDKIAKYALLASSPIAQARALKAWSASMKKKQATQDAAPVTTDMPLDQTTGIPMDDNSGQPSIYYGPDAPAVDAQPGDQNTPYFDPQSNMWYDPASDTYYDQSNDQYYDGYFNPINANGSPINSINTQANGQESIYYNQSATDGSDALPGVVYDQDSGLWYDYPTDTYFNPSTGQYYDGYLNPIDDQSDTLQGLGALGKFRVHVAKSAYLKTAGIVGAAAAVVGCIYASGGCAAYVGADAALLSAAYAKSKPNPKDAQVIANRQAVAQAEKDNAAHNAALHEALTTPVDSQETIPAQPHYDPSTGLWYDEGSNTYYDPASNTVYDPNQPQQVVQDKNNLQPASY